VQEISCTLQRNILPFILPFALPTILPFILLFRGVQKLHGWQLRCLENVSRGTFLLMTAKMAEVAYIIIAIFVPMQFWCCSCQNGMFLVKTLPKWQLVNEVQEIYCADEK